MSKGKPINRYAVGEQSTDKEFFIEDNLERFASYKQKENQMKVPTFIGSLGFLFILFLQIQHLKVTFFPPLVQVIWIGATVVFAMLQSYFGVKATHYYHRH